MCLAVTCHLHFWQNDWGLLHATVVTRGWNRYRNKSQHRKLTLEKKILPPLLQGFKPVTFRSWVRHSNHWVVTTIPSQLHHISITCSPQSHHSFVAFPSQVCHISVMFITFPLHFHHMFIAFPSHAHHVSITCSSLFHHMFISYCNCVAGWTATMLSHHRGHLEDSRCQALGVSCKCTSHNLWNVW